MEKIITQFWDTPLKYLIILVGIVFLLDKVIGFKTIVEYLKFLSKGGYKFTKREHCNDPKLLSLLEDYKHSKFDEVEKTLLNFSADYRDFGFRSLAEIEDKTLIERWIKQSRDSDLPQIVLAYQKVEQAWKIQGVGTVDSVSANDLSRVKAMLQEAKEILIQSKETTSAFDINKDIGLLRLFKAIDLESRDIIHETFQHGLSIDPKHIGLHIAYFTAISEKWGGTKEELNSYFELIPNDPPLLGNCIQAIYYWDLVKVYQIDDEAMEKKIIDFVMQTDQQGIPKDNLYRYELYLRIYWLASVHIEGLEEKYYQLVKPYWEDK